MTDVLIVCVRDDEVQAKSLADLFEREQMTVGGAPADEAGLRNSGAVVILWSQASIRSRPFLDAAQRAVNAHKAVVACLIDAPPSSSLNQSPCFDLRDWSGSPDDPLIDPLYFAVDRMVNAQRAANPAPETSREASREREQPRAPAPSYAAPPPYARARQAPAPQAPPQPRYEPQAYAAPQPAPEPPRQRRMSAPAADAADPVSAEALRWKAIRHSRDPAAFLHYLAEYGPDGAFSELAELRLKQLQDANATPLKAAARAVAQESQRRAPEPAPPPPRREQPAARREPPPERDRDYAREAAPMRAPERHIERERHVERAAERHVERNYETYPPLRGARTGGGAARVMMLALLLGGGALAAGFYFANGQGLLGPGGEPAFAAIEEQQPAALEETAIEDPPFISPETAVGGPIEESEPVSVARPAAAPTPEQRRAEPARTPRFEPVVTEAESTQLMPRPISPAPTQLAALDPNTVRAPIMTPGAVVWVTRATAQQFSDHYPSSARRAGIAGRVQLTCSITGDLAPNCTVLSETPQGYGFGQAALRVSRSFRARNTLDDGSPAPGANANLNFTFRPAE